MSTGSRYLRQLGWYNPTNQEGDAVTFVGVGGIGSFAAFGAAKLGIPNITLIDPDIVEEHNQPNQMYSIHDVGDHKVSALKGYIDDAGDLVQNWYTGEALDVVNKFSGVVVSGLDSMEARSELWHEAIKLKPRVPLYLDARLGGQIIVVYAVNPTNMHDIEQYETTLYSDEEAEAAPCTERGVIDVGLMVGSVLTRHLRSHFTGGEVPKQTIVNQETLAITKAGWNDE